MINALLICLALVKSGKKMSEIFPEFEFDPYVFVSVAVKDRETVKKAVISDKVLGAVAKAEAKMAGIGRVVLHPSGTEPKIRVWVSGSDEKTVRESADMIINEVKKFQEEK